MAYSSQYARGNENNAHQAGTFTSRGNTRTLSGSGTVPGYAVVNLQGKYRPEPHVEWFVRLNNLLNQRYATGGLLGENALFGRALRHQR